ncbi:halocyanin domain-containing protein [Halobellus ordinarius]|uniref:halocyanin domain-containing protein n=1 Tax=Halobellus ordinarius TaxID=3075120 RepID=UPI00288082B5|nr:halocyanin domain-containing protein [Halobellus sp. ZY16]
MSRRGALRAIGGGVAATAAAGAVPAAASAQSDGTDLEAWFDNVSNYDGVVDRTESDAVTVDVGVEANQGAFGFGPAAIRVTPGTTVTWEWTGAGSSHNVVDTDDAFGSELVEDSGHTFEHTFESEGTFTYVCVPHETLGMKGAVVVGESGGDGDGGAESGVDPLAGSRAGRFGALALGGIFALALASPGLFGLFVWLKERSGGSV